MRNRYHRSQISWFGRDSQGSSISTLKWKDHTRIKTTTLALLARCSDQMSWSECPLTCNKFFIYLNVSPLTIPRFPSPQDKSHSSLLLLLPRTEARPWWVSRELEASIMHTMHHSILMLFIYPFTSAGSHLFKRALPSYSLLFRPKIHNRLPYEESRDVKSSAEEESILYE